MITRNQIHSLQSAEEIFCVLHFFHFAHAFVEDNLLIISGSRQKTLVLHIKHTLSIILTVDHIEYSTFHDIAQYPFRFLLSGLQDSSFSISMSYFNITSNLRFLPRSIESARLISNLISFQGQNHLIMKHRKTTEDYIKRLLQNNKNSIYVLHSSI